MRWIGRPGGNDITIYYCQDNRLLTSYFLPGTKRIPVADPIGGAIQVMVDALPSAMPHVGSRRIRARSLAGTKRSGIVPDLASADETGIRRNNQTG